jgi:hypothetical protein
VGASIVAGHDLNVIVAWPSVSVFVLYPRIREMDMAVLVRQVMFTRPSHYFLWLPVRPSVAVLPAAITLVQKSLVVALQLVVQDDAVHSAALLADTLLSAQVCAIDLRVVRQFSRLSEARVVRLAWLVTAAVTLVPICLEQVPAAFGEDDGAVVGVEWRRVQQTLSFEVALGAACVIAAVVEIALGHDAKGADGGKHPAFGAVDLVDAIALSHRPTLTGARQVNILREHVTRVAIVRRFAFVASTAAAAVPLDAVAAVAVTR